MKTVHYLVTQCMKLCSDFECRNFFPRTDQLNHRRANQFLSFVKIIWMLNAD